jgi:hypothetical protein
MLQVIEQIPEEQFKMYMKIPKKQLILMLIECNKQLNMMLEDFKLNNPFSIMDEDYSDIKDDHSDGPKPRYGSEL